MFILLIKALEDINIKEQNNIDSIKFIIISKLDILKVIY